MTDRIVTDGCAICCVLNNQRLSAITAGDCARLARVREMIAMHDEEHQQADRERTLRAFQLAQEFDRKRIERAFEKIQAARLDDTMATPNMRRW